MKKQTVELIVGDGMKMKDLQAMILASPHIHRKQDLSPETIEAMLKSDNVSAYKVTIEKQDR